MSQATAEKTEVMEAPKEETLREYDDRHPDWVQESPYVQIAADGAVFRNSEFGRDGARGEPPTDPIELARICKRWLTAKIKERRKVGNNAQAQWDEMGELAIRDSEVKYPPPPENAVEKLAELEAEINGYEKELREVNEKLSDTPEAKAQQNAARTEAERVQNIKMQLDKIRSFQF